MSLWKKKDLMIACKASDPTSKFLKNFDNIRGISIDDRTVREGDLFIALIGDKFDGHNFVGNAISKGACGVLVSDIKLANKYNGLFVKDTKKALIQIGQYARDMFNGITICITGSSGKTSTNYLLSKSLKKFGKTHKTFGNNNNIIGLSLTLSRLPNDYDFCVLELGMNNAGEIRELSKIARPNIALITNVSSSHIENFKNEKEIAKAKSEIFSGLKNDGVAIINSDNVWKHFLIAEAKKVNAKIHLYGSEKNSDTIIEKIIDDKGGSTIFYDEIENWHLKYLNITQAENVIATIAILKELKLDPEKIHTLISDLKPISGRGEKLIINFNKNEKTFVIDDSYNANPASMKAALHNFNRLKLKLHNFETVIIIGDMLELGKHSTKMHLELVPIIQKIKPDLLLTIGNNTKKISDELKLTINCHSYYKIDQLVKDIKQFIKPNQIILLKGSNGTGLWRLVSIFKDIMQENANAA